LRRGCLPDEPDLFGRQAVGSVNELADLLLKSAGLAGDRLGGNDRLRVLLAKAAKAGQAQRFLPGPELLGLVDRLEPWWIQPARDQAVRPFVELEFASIVPDREPSEKVTRIPRAWA